MTATNTVERSHWLTLIRRILPLIESNSFRLSAEETKKQLDKNPIRFFDMVREQIGDINWPNAFNSEQERKMSQALYDADRYGEAVYKLGLKQGLTPVIACAAYYMEFGYP